MAQDADNIVESRGWGTWIRTKAARSRAGSSTAKLSPKRTARIPRQTDRQQPSPGRAKIASTVRVSPSCHAGRRSPNTVANLPQSSRESGGRVAFVGH